MYIVGQERRLVNPPSQVVAGVRTVTTKMNGRDALPRMSRPFAFSIPTTRFHGMLITSSWFLAIGAEATATESAGGE
jgi:hypothetical protein